MHETHIDGIDSAMPDLGIPERRFSLKSLRNIGACAALLFATAAAWRMAGAEGGESVLSHADCASFAADTQQSRALRDAWFVQGAQIAEDIHSFGTPYAIALRGCSFIIRENESGEIARVTDPVVLGLSKADIEAGERSGVLLAFSEQPHSRDRAAHLIDLHDYEVVEVISEASHEVMSGEVYADDFGAIKFDRLTGSSWPNPEIASYDPYM